MLSNKATRTWPGIVRVSPGHVRVFFPKKKNRVTRECPGHAVGRVQTNFNKFISKFLMYIEIKSNSF